MLFPYYIVLCILTYSICTADHASIYSQCKNHSIVAKNSGNIAIGIAGVSKSLQYTLPLFEKYIIGTLEKSNFIYDVYWSALLSMTKEELINCNEYPNICPCQYSVTTNERVQHEQWSNFCIARGFKCSKGLINSVAGFVYGPGGQIFTRLEKRHFGKYVTPRSTMFKENLATYYSHKELASLIRSHTELNGFKYDAVLVIRPDVAILRPIDLPLHFYNIMRQSNTIWIPDFQESGGYNTRAAFGNQDIMLQYLDRGIEFMANNSYHLMLAEPFLKKFIGSRFWTVVPSKMRFLRITAGIINGTKVGLIHPQDSSIRNMNFQSGENIASCTGPVCSQLNLDNEVSGADFVRCTSREMIRYENSLIKFLNVSNC